MELLFEVLYKNAKHTIIFHKNPDTGGITYTWNGIVTRENWNNLADIKHWLTVGGYNLAAPPQHVYHTDPIINKIRMMEARRKQTYVTV